MGSGTTREYQAIIAYVVYSQVLKGAEYMSIASQLEEHAHQELQHALTISRQIDYLGKMPGVTPKPVKTSDKPRDMLKFDLDKPRSAAADRPARSTRRCRRRPPAGMRQSRPEVIARQWSSRAHGWQQGIAIMGHWRCPVQALGEPA
jgi:bacterioferritin